MSASWRRPWVHVTAAESSSNTQLVIKFVFISSLNSPGAHHIDHVIAKQIPKLCSIKRFGKMKTSVAPSRSSAWRFTSFPWWTGKDSELSEQTKYGFALIKAGRMAFASSTQSGGEYCMSSRKKKAIPKLFRMRYGKGTRDPSLRKKRFKLSSGH